MKELDIIKSIFGHQKSERSDVLYINHIYEGLQVLEGINATQEAKKAYCVHPIFQVPKNLKQCISSELYKDLDPYTIVLAMEYRNKANAYVCRQRTDHFTITDLPYMVLPEVKDMLIADKVQNYKDFLLYHKDTHPRRKQLDKYFNLWFVHLGVNYKELVQHIKT